MSRLTPGSPGNFSTGGSGGSVTIASPLGQALAAASIPVVLPAAQIATLTPLSTVAATQSGNWTTRVVGNIGGVFDAVDSATYPANVLAIGSKDSSGGLTHNSSPARNGDANNGDAAFSVGGLLFNNSTYDRIRSIINSTDSTGAGIQAVGNLAQFDDTSPSSVTENQFANLRMNSARQLYVQPIKIDTFGTTTAFTITLASLANSTAGVGRQSTLVTSNTASSAMIAVKFTVGTTPTANSLIYVYLIRGDGTINDDNAGASDAGLTVINAPLLGTILVPAATSNTAYYGVFDTKFLGSLSKTFGIAIVNSSGVTANGTGGNFTAEYTLIT